MVEKRNPIFVVILCLFTFGIYMLYWLFKTKEEMVQLGANIPTFFLIIIPIANIFWIYKYFMGVEHISKGSDKPVNGILYLVLYVLLAPIAIYLTQNELNKHV